MGYLIYREVQRHAPAELTWRELYVLGVLADEANDHTRECFPGFDGETANSAEFRRRVRCSRSQFFATLKALAEKGALEVVSSGHKGHRAVYRVPVMAPASARLSVPESGTLCPSDSVPESGTLLPEQGAIGSRFRVHRVPETGTPSPQSPQNPLPTYVPADPDAAQGAARQEGGKHTPNPNTADYVVVESGAVSASVENGDKSGDGGTDTAEPGSASGLREAAARVLSRVDLGRSLKGHERKHLTARLCVLLGNGYAEGALVKTDWEGVRNRVAAYRSELDKLPDFPEPVVVAPEPKRGPTYAEAMAAVEALVAADVAADLAVAPEVEPTEVEQGSGRAMFAQLRRSVVQNAASAPQGGSGVLAPGSAARRREGPALAFSGASVLRVSDRISGSPD